MRFLLLALLLLAPACCSKAPEPGSTSESEATPSRTAITAEGFEKISLARTGCYGFCPTYEVTIYADGLVVYQGYEHVQVLGERQGSADADGIAALVRACQQLDFFELDDQYKYKLNEDGEPYTITDQPSRILTLTVAGQSKQVEQYFGGPEALRALADQIDAVAGTAVWTKKADE
jgi:hypothetical protein